MRSRMADVLDVVGALHAGVADPAQWEAGLDGLGDLLGGASFLIGHVGDGSASLSISGHRISSDAVSLMAGPLANPFDNPWLGAIPSLPFRKPVTVDDIGGRSVVEGTRVGKEVMLAFDFRQTMGAILERRPEGVEFMMVGRSWRAGEFSKDEIDLFALVIPHLARALRVRRELEATRALAADGMAALEALSRGVVLVGEGGEVCFSNSAARRIFEDQDGLTERQGRLQTDREADATALRTIIHAASRTASGRDHVAAGATAVSRRSGKQSYALVAEPLSAAHRERLGARKNAGAVVFVADPERSGSPGPARLAAVYGLSGAEANVAAAVARGDSLREVAAAQGVSHNTIRSQLRAACDKIGVSRQAELVFRIASDLGGLV